LGDDVVEQGQRNGIAGSCFQKRVDEAVTRPPFFRGNGNEMDFIGRLRLFQ